jgi:hypothetical protein
MLNVNIFGQYAFADLPSIAVADLSQDDLYSQLQAFAAEESRMLSQLVAAVADEGSNVKESFGYVAGGQLQRIGEMAQPEATRRGGKWDVAYPLYAWGDRKIYTPEYLERASLADLNADVVEATLKDVNTVLAVVFDAFSNKTNKAYDDDPWPGDKTGAHTVRRLANADAQVGYAYFNGQQVALATAQHYKTSGAATIAVGAFETIRDTLQAVGNGDDIVYFVSYNTGETLKGGTLGADFVPVPDPKLSILPTVQTPIVASPRAIGRVANGEVQVWPHFPDGYIFGYDRSKPRPVRVRIPTRAGDRGFRLVADESRGGDRPGKPLVNKYWQRIFGAGVRNRLNGVMMQITTSGAYTNPSLL